MAYSNLHSKAGTSSIEKLEACLADDNMSLLDAFESRGIFSTTQEQHMKIGTKASLPSSCSSSRCSRYSTASEQSLSCLSSRRSSYDTVSPFSIADDNNIDDDRDNQYETFECFDYADEEKKRPPSSDDEDDNDNEAGENRNEAIGDETIQHILPGTLFLLSITQMFNVLYYHDLIQNVQTRKGNFSCVGATGIIKGFSLIDKLFFSREHFLNSFFNK